MDGVSVSGSTSSNEDLKANDSSNYSSVTSFANQLNYANLTEKDKMSIRAARFGSTISITTMQKHQDSVAESQKLSQRAARFGISSSNRGF